MELRLINKGGGFGKESPLHAHYGGRSTPSFCGGHLTPTRGLMLKLRKPLNHNTTTTMRFLNSFLPSLLLGAGVAQAVSSWGFDEAIISVSGKAATGFKDK